MAVKRRVWNHVLFWSIAILVVVLDRVTKLLVVDHMKLGESVPLLPFISLTYVHNLGTAFGLFQNAGLFFMVFAAVVSVYIVCTYRKYSVGLKVIVALLLGGALGNLIDRLVYGTVIDFIDFHIWPVFNVADSAVTIAIILLLLREFMSRNHRKV